MSNKTDIVFNICRTMLENSPERSYKRLNPALRGTLAACIEADLPFQLDTFQRIYKGLRGSWWFGDGCGSHVGEHYYTTACGMNHAGAQQSFEQFAERPACLWEENAKTPERLHIGSQFTWRGQYVTVTSMRQDSLVACTYKDYKPEVKGLKTGATLGYNPSWLITSSKRDGAAAVLRVVEAKEDSGSRDIAKRFTIPYAEISELRRSAKARLKVVLDKIAQCDPAKDAERLTKEINAEHFRHFEFEQINVAFARRKDWLKDEAKVQAWRNGENGAWLGDKATMLRILADRVECSNGNSVSKAAASRVLPVLLDQRKATASVSIPVDSYTVEHISHFGVKIGCTLVPWGEIDLIKSQL